MSDGPGKDTGLFLSESLLSAVPRYNSMVPYFVRAAEQYFGLELGILPTLVFDTRIPVTLALKSDEIEFAAAAIIDDEIVEYRTNPVSILRKQEHYVRLNIHTQPHQFDFIVPGKPLDSDQEFAAYAVIVECIAQSYLHGAERPQDAFSTIITSALLSYSQKIT